MLLLVCSDSHGNTSNLRRAVTEAASDRVLFLGDGVRDAARVAREFPELPFQILRGNCDHDDTEHEDSALFTLEGVRIFAAHGHRHGVKYGLDAFTNSVCCANAAIGLYGHTHRALARFTEGVTLLNPGSIGNRVSPTYALVELKNGAYDCKIVDILPENRG